MPPHLDRLVLGLDWIDERARLLLPAVMFWTLLGLSSVYWGVTRPVVLEQTSIISSQLVFEAGWLLTAGSGLFVAGVGVASIILWVIEWMAVRRIPKSPMSGAIEETPARGESREQVPLRRSWADSFYWWSRGHWPLQQTISIRAWRLVRCSHRQGRYCLRWLLMQ